LVITREQVDQVVAALEAALGAAESGQA